MKVIQRVQFKDKERIQSIRRQVEIPLEKNIEVKVKDELTPTNAKTPDFKVSTQYFEVENNISWGTLGDTDEYFYQTIEEKHNK